MTTEEKKKMLWIKTDPGVDETVGFDDDTELVVLVPENAAVIDAQDEIKRMLDDHDGPVWCGDCQNVAVMALVMKELRLRGRDGDWVTDKTVH